jgi:hypothetical protein
MNKSEIIIWEKWRDPLGYDDIDENIPKIEEEDKDDDEEYCDVEENKKNVVIKNIKEQFILTPLGIIPLTENTASSKIFNFWTGHTIFPISKKIVNIIENIDGVETLDIFTRYRFRLSVGKAFDDSVVLRKVNELVFNQIAPQQKYEY